MKQRSQTSSSIYFLSKSKKKGGGRDFVASLQIKEGKIYQVSEFPYLLFPVVSGDLREAAIDACGRVKDSKLSWKAWTSSSLG